MSDKHNQDLCALMDGELSEQEARFLIRRLGHDRQLADRWERLHQTRDILRGNRHRPLNGLSGRIAAAVQAEPAVIAEPAGVGTPNWLRPVAGMAVAASVAVVAFGAFQSQLETPEPVTAVTPGLATLEAPGAAQQVTPALRANLASTGSDAWSNPRLQAYMLRHNEVAAPRRSRGLVPYVYMISAQPPRGTAQAQPDPVDGENAERPEQTGN